MNISVSQQLHILKYLKLRDLQGEIKSELEGLLICRRTKSSELQPRQRCSKVKLSCLVLGRFPSTAKDD